MRALIFALSAGLIASAASGCAGIALLYRHTVQPLDLNMNRTASGPDLAAGAGITQLAEPISGAQISMQLYSNAFGDIYPANQLAEAYYADLETRSYVLGIWRKYTVRLSGKKVEH